MANFKILNYSLVVESNRIILELIAKIRLPARNVVNIIMSVNYKRLKTFDLEIYHLPTNKKYLVACELRQRLNLF